MLINDYYVEAGLFASAYILEAKLGSWELCSYKVTSKICGALKQQFLLLLKSGECCTELK